MSPDWIASEKETINPSNEKDNKWLPWAIISGLNYNKIKEKELKNFFMIAQRLGKIWRKQ